MDLLDFVKQHDTVWFAAHPLAELAPLFVPDIGGRCADQPGNGVLLHVLAHVESNHRVFVIEQKLGQRATQFGLPHSSRTEEDEGTNWPIFVLQTSSGATYRIGNRPDRFALSDHSLSETLFHMNELFFLTLLEPGYRNPGPTCDHLRDILRGNFFLQDMLRLLQLRQSLVVGLKLLHQVRQTPILNLAGLRQIALPLSLF